MGGRGRRKRACDGGVVGCRMGEFCTYRRDGGAWYIEPIFSHVLAIICQGSKERAVTCLMDLFFVHCDAFYIAIKLYSVSQVHLLVLGDEPRYPMCGYGHPITPAVICSPDWISPACDFSSSTSQFAQTNLPFRNAASGLASQTRKCAGSWTMGKGKISNVALVV